MLSPGLLECNTIGKHKLSENSIQKW